MKVEQPYEFRKKLLCEEKSAATIEKYIHDLKVWDVSKTLTFFIFFNTHLH